MQNKFLIKQTDNAKDLPIPKYMSDGAAGMDLYANVQKPVLIPAGEIVKIPVGIQISMPHDFEAQIRPRSGLAAKAITIANAPGTVDSDYRGEIQIIIINLSKNDFLIERGLRVAQMVINKIERVEFELVDELDETERGSGGFGHTGL